MVSHRFCFYDAMMVDFFGMRVMPQSQSECFEFSFDTMMQLEGLFYSLLSLKIRRLRRYLSKHYIFLPMDKVRTKGEKERNIRT